jgi:hypothetical protein
VFRFSGITINRNEVMIRADGLSIAMDRFGARRLLAMLQHEADAGNLSPLEEIVAPQMAEAVKK